MLQGASGRLEPVDGPRQVEPGAPDGRVVGAPPGAAVEPGGGLVEPPGLGGEARPGQPDPVVVGGQARCALDLGADLPEQGRGGIDPPVVEEVADRVGRRGPAPLDQPEDRVAPPLPEVQLGERAADLVAPGPGRGGLQERLEEGLAVAEPAEVADERPGARQPGIERPARPGSDARPGRQGALEVALGLRTGTEPVGDLFVARPSPRQVVQDPPRLGEAGAGHELPGPLQIGLEAEPGDDSPPQTGQDDQGRQAQDPGRACAHGVSPLPSRIHRIGDVSAPAARRDVNRRTLRCRPPRGPVPPSRLLSRRVGRADGTADPSRGMRRSRVSLGSDRRERFGY